jgi:hypothetical protein
MSMLGCAAPAGPRPHAAASPAPAAAEPVVTPTAAAPVVTRDPFDYGTTTGVRPDANPQAASVGQALHDRNHPERLSPIIAPQPFDRAAYHADPAAYLNVVEPGRVFQVAQPGPDVLRIQAVGPTLATIDQGGTVPLRVHALAGMPVTFTSFDLGRFAENQLTSISVAADDQGIAHVTFVGDSGTINEVNILAACPLTAGQVTYHINVRQSPE